MQRRLETFPKGASARTAIEAVRETGEGLGKRVLPAIQFFAAAV